MDLNKAVLIGNLTKDPETKELSSGRSVTKVTVATNYNWKDKTSGEKKEKATFHTVIGWNKLAGIMGQYLKKGDKVYFEGRIDNRTWEDKDGKKKYFTDVVATDMIMLGGKSKKAEEQANETKIVEEETGESPF